MRSSFLNLALGICSVFLLVGCEGGGITVSGPAPTSSATSAPSAALVSLSQGIPMDPISPLDTSGGAFSSCASQPSLPTGLSLSPSTCEITGTPSALSAPATYTLSATLSTGALLTGSLQLAIVSVSAPSFSYSLVSATYPAGSAITPNGPSSSALSSFLSFTVSPSLPVGLTLDNSTGMISGTPNIASDSTSYTVTGTTYSGQSYCVITITVTGGGGSLAIPAEVLSGYQYFDNLGGSHAGSMTNQGVLDLDTTAIPASSAGYYSSISTTLTSSSICSSSNLFGEAGTAICESGTSSSPASASNILSGTEAWNSAGSKMTGTMPVGSDKTGTNGSLSITLPAGYYDGTKTATAVDSNLTSANILSGTTIFGVSGSVIASPANCSSNDEVNCVANASYVASAPQSSNVSGANGSLNFLIPQGYYSGAQHAIASDSNLVASKILSGTTIFGVSGSATQAYSSCTDNALNASQCSTAASRYVATTAGSSFTGSNGSKVLTIPQGYYSGSQTATAADTNLIASNLISTATIFGVTGSVTACNASNQTSCVSSATFPTQSTPATPATAATVLSGKQFYAGGAQVTGTMPNQGNWNENTTAFPGAGYYSGLTSTLTPSLVCTGTNVYGSAGAAVCEGASGGTNATAANVLTGTYFWNSSGVSTEGTMAVGSNVSGTNASLSITIPQGYYSGSQTATAADTNLTAANIVTGVSIFGTAGTGGSIASLTGSNASRTLGTTQITEYAETNTYGSTTLPTGYRDLPDITKDDDGYNGGSVTYASRPTVTCGTTQTTVAARIAACATANPTTSSWSGATDGNAGQGTWHLVTYVGTNSLYTGKNAEVWQDSRTGLLWSSLVAGTTLDNWCKAAGNGQTTGNGYAANDPSGYCNSATYQPNYVSNAVAFAVESYCGETNTVPALSAEGTSSWSGTYVAAKGGMGAQSSSSSPSVYWRLPTKYDYQQADNDGIRFVMPDMGTHSPGNEWSASVVSSNRTNGWTFNSVYGPVAGNTRTASYAVRCVGR